jgi:NHLM bacteriocin system ABC transporter peptidase/ATP-binding protein
MSVEAAPEKPVIALKQLTTAPRRVKVPTILQQAQVECGAACLGMVLAHYERWESLDTLRKACGVSRDGANAIAIVEAGATYGLDFAANRGTLEDLHGLAVPSIVWVRRSHFVVLEGIHNGTVYLNDPARGRREAAVEDFAIEYSGAAITLTPNTTFTKQGHAYRATPALWARLKNSASGVRFAIFAGLLAMLLGLVIAPISQLFINGALEAGTSSLIPTLVVALLVIGLFRGGLTLLEFGVISRLQAKMTMVGTGTFVDRLVRLPLLFYMERSLGDLSQRVGYNSQVASLLATQMASAGIALVGAIGYAALLLYYNWIIGLVVIVLSLLNVVVLRVVMSRRTAIQGRVIRRQNDLRGTTTAAIQGIETIKSTGMEDDIFKTLTGQQSEYITASAALVPTTALLVAFPILLFSLTSASILVLGGYFTIIGTFTIGGLLAVTALAANLNNPIQTLMSTGGQLQVITSSLQALDDVMANEQGMRFNRPRLNPGDPVPRTSGSISMNNVSFAYSDQAPLAINDLSLELTPGKRIALVGASGAGKTTIGNLAAGLFAPSSGDVLYDGKTLADYPIGVIERSISKVDQSIVLFEGTVRQNVTLWDSTVPEEDIRRALADAQILDDILARENGLDCTVSENGRNFSGGQCQRIEIARALVLNPRTIILDEATSALDDITESLVDQALRRRGVACLIIAHRLSTIRDADEIIVLGKAGAILQRGQHDDLMAQDGPYRTMVNEAGAGGNVGT